MASLPVQSPIVEMLIAQRNLCAHFSPQSSLRKTLLAVLLNLL